MKSPHFRRSPNGIIKSVLWSIALAVCTGELRADQPKSPTNDDLAKRTLRALGEAAGPNRRQRDQAAPPRDGVTLPASLAVAEEVAAPAKQSVNTRPMEPAPLADEPSVEEPMAVAPLPGEPPSGDRAGWYSADRRANTPRQASIKPAKSKAAATGNQTSKTARTEIARATVRWADARGDDGEAVRPAADWRGAASVTMRGTAGRFNPLRNSDHRDEATSSKTRGLNPLRAN